MQLFISILDLLFSELLLEPGAHSLNVEIFEGRFELTAVNYLSQPQPGNPIWILKL